MNGYTLMAESYKKAVEKGKIEKEVADKEIRIYDFLATCDEDDMCRLVDSGAFNDIIKAYIELAIKNADIGEKAKEQALSQVRWVFDIKNAKEALADYYK